MKQIAFTTAFVAAGWMIAVAAYAMYEAFLAHEGLDPLSAFDYHQGLISAMNFALPSGIGCLLFLWHTNKSSPVNKSTVIICLATMAGACLLSFKARDTIYHGDNEAFAEAIWWMPSSNKVDGYDF